MSANNFLLIKEDYSKKDFTVILCDEELGQIEILAYFTDLKDCCKFAQNYSVDEYVEYGIQFDLC